MKIFKFYCLFCKTAAVAVLVLGLANCVLPAEEDVSEQSLTLMTWNIHNLFDGKDNGYEYAEFLESSGWSNEKYLGRINTISAAIETVDPKPDIIIFQEIESLGILDDLASSISKDFKWSNFANYPGMALGLGIISSYPILESKVHSITIDGETTPRPVLEARIDTGDDSFVLFACHWKSKIGDELATENVRKSSARVILRRIRELWKTEPELGVIICGDLNENHDEFKRINASMICALVPDDDYCAQLADQQVDFLITSGNIPPVPVCFPDDFITFFSPWIDELENGSYYYKNNWETIDHFLISPQFFNDKNWEYESAAVIKYKPFVNSSGSPFQYNQRTGTGLSDHLPLLITLRFVK